MQGLQALLSPVGANNVGIALSSSSDDFDPPFSHLPIRNTDGGSVHCENGSWLTSDGSPVANVTGLRYTFENGTLHFPAFDWASYVPEIHSTAYQCSNYLSAANQEPTLFYVNFTSQGEQRSKRQSFALVERFRPQALAPGAGLQLWCGARGASRFVWARDGAPLSPGPPEPQPLAQTMLRASYNISRALPEDAGTYSCTAVTSNNETITHEARIDVYGPPYIRSLGPIKILSGTTAVIHCPYYGYPISKAKWERSDLQPIHYERYKRNIISNATTTRTIDVPYDFFKKNQFEEYKKETAQMELLKQTSTTSISRRHRRAFTADEEGKLVIENVDSSENGAMYTCTVTSPTGEMARRSFEIQVLEPPLLDELTFGSNIQEGQIAKVVCSVKSGDTPVFFNWLKDGLPISSSLKIEERNLDLFSVLVIRKVGLQHCGTFTCIASNHAARVNASAELFIKVAPKWVEEPQNSSMVIGRQGHVGCSASGYPQPQVHWMKRDEGSGAWRSVLEQRGSGLQSLPNGSLVLEMVASGDEGVYSCRVENGVGQPLHKDIFISINRPVNFESPVSNVTTKVGYPATVMCEVFGDHPIRIFWTHNGRSLEFVPERMKVTSHQTQRGATSEILVSSTDPTDSGVWLCKASNAFGAAQHSTYLTVQEPPGPPVEVSVEAVRGRTVRIGWRAPPVPPSLYMLQYAPHHHLHWDSATTINVTNIPSQTRQFTEVSGLRPATPYAARLCSAGVAGLSPYTRPLLFTTLEEAPTSAPLNVQVEAGPGPGELQIAWLTPPIHTLHGLLLGYLIRAVPQITHHDEEKASVLKVGPGGQQATLTGLTKGGRYSVTVSCYNSAGVGPSSPAVYRDTPEGVPEVPPEELQCSAVSSSSLRVSWRPLPPHLQGGAMTGYTLYYSTMDGIQNNMTSVHSSVQLEGLQKFSNYSVWVAGYCRIGMGPASRPVLCTTMEDIPTAPADVKALVLTSSSLFVSWLPPLHPNGRITHYTVYLRLAHGGGTMQSYRVPDQWSSGGDRLQDSLSHAVRGLEQGKRYEAWVTAATLVGEGEASRTVSAEPSDRVVAGVSSLGGKLVVGAGSALKLACRALGSPQPRTVWYHNTRVITHHPSFILNNDDSLLINNINPSLEGNYTCVAKNLFGWDSVSYVIEVVAPPSPPRLRAIPERQALLLDWAPPNHTSPILGYTLSWRSGLDIWQTEDIAGGAAGTKRIGSLGCGKQYEVRLVALGTVGPSSPAVAIATTLGTVMTAPTGTDWIWSNSSHLSLQLDRWRDGECGAARWSVDYRPLSTRLWLQPDPLPVENGYFLTLGGLRPARWYQIRVTATNQAGPIAAIYTVATKTEFGEMIGPPSDPLDTSILVMVCSCVLLLLCMLVCVFVAIQKHRHRVMCGSSAESVYKERGCAPLAASRPLPTPDCPPLPARLYTSPTANRKASNPNSEMFEISPYAQFSMGFQTFGHVDNQDRPAYVKAKQGIFSTETSFQMGSESDDSDSLTKSTPLSHTQNKTCRVQYHR